ncbi:MAG: bifunctional demethylmenaquinone methyltransferase/2-methoxy-6-polyprenyl-1,4-benzoquinol methylase UbiE, partial [Bacteroidia bacterium]|nr:bifunctional demethylmenaquinone methyltransferase/2-methoxy-6-polyprenyl-1,4-benzoquinol methylase UbiE [Bacteroidia bacterium]
MEDQYKISDQDQKAQIVTMFDDIAFRYDFLNHLLSFGIDRIWRKKAIKVISETHKNSKVLDVACGTGDLSIAALKLDPEYVTGIDISQKMIDLGREKIKRRVISDRIELIKGDSEKIPFDDNSFDVAMAAFGVRNFPDPLKGLTEMTRVIKKGGLVMVLEFSKPSGYLIKQVYTFYFLKILPFIGKQFSKNKQAYSYLPSSVMQ